MERERRWVEHIRRGDERAFEKLFYAYHPRLCAFAAGYVGSYAAARDVVQDVFLEVWQGRRSWTLHTSLKPYLYQAVRNQSLSHLKQETRRATRERAVGANRQAVKTAEDAYRQKELEAAIWEAVDRLPERRREAFILHRRHGFTYREIAQMMGIRPKAVEKKISHALKFLGETLPPEYF